MRHESAEKTKIYGLFFIHMLHTQNLGGYKSGPVFLFDFIARDQSDPGIQGLVSVRNCLNGV